MKTKILTLAITLLSLTSFSQDKAYYQKLGQTLQQFGSCASIEDFQKCGNQFKMIANAEPKEWLPLYYHAHAHIIMSFMENSANKRDEILDEAKSSIDKILEMYPQEVEAVSLKAFYFTAKLVVDPMSRGQEYSGLFGQAIGQALAIDHKNPRARYIKLSNSIGAASFFGTDPKEYKEAAESLLADWDNYALKSPLHPSWGKEQVVEIINELSK